MEETNLTIAKLLKFIKEPQFLILLASEGADVPSPPTLAILFVRSKIRHRCPALIKSTL